MQKGGFESRSRKKHLETLLGTKIFVSDFAMNSFAFGRQPYQSKLKLILGD